MTVMFQVPLVASNRVGTEKADKSSITFYGGSFIAGPTGEIIKQVRRRLSQPFQCDVMFWRVSFAM